MQKIFRAYRILNLLSLDVAIGAMICAMFFGRLLHVAILPYGFAALGLTVWIIYTADHLRDAKAIRHKATSERHRFHQDHFNVLAMMTAVGAIIDIVVIFFIRKPVFLGGIVLTIFVGVYLLFQSRVYFLKEIFVAVLY